jgi:hypothetical protein
MNNRLINAIIFVAGAAIGSAITWKIVKTKYEQIAKEEIESVKEVFSKKYKTLSQSIEDTVPGLKEFSNDLKEVSEQPNRMSASMKPDIHEYTAMLKGKGYLENDIDEVKDMEKPYVIEPDEFGEMDGYDVISLTYYSDKVLTDELDELVEDVDNVVGYDSLNHFGEYEDDSVFVRNDRLKADYEILLDTRSYYTDVINTKAHPVEDE